MKAWKFLAKYLDAISENVEKQNYEVKQVSEGLGSLEKRFEDISKGFSILQENLKEVADGLNKLTKLFEEGVVFKNIEEIVDKNYRLIEKQINISLYLTKRLLKRLEYVEKDSRERTVKIMEEFDDFSRLFEAFVILSQQNYKRQMAIFVDKLNELVDLQYKELKSVSEQLDKIGSSFKSLKQELVSADLRSPRSRSSSLILDLLTEEREMKKGISKEKKPKSILSDLLEMFAYTSPTLFGQLEDVLYKTHTQALFDVLMGTKGLTSFFGSVIKGFGLDILGKFIPKAMASLSNLFSVIGRYFPMITSIVEALAGFLSGPVGAIVGVVLAVLTAISFKIGSMILSFATKIIRVLWNLVKDKLVRLFKMILGWFISGLEKILGPVIKLSKFILQWLTKGFITGLGLVALLRALGFRDIADRIVDFVKVFVHSYVIPFINRMFKLSQPYIKQIGLFVVNLAINFIKELYKIIWGLIVTTIRQIDIKGLINRVFDFTVKIIDKGLEIALNAIIKGIPLTGKLIFLIIRFTSDLIITVVSSLRKLIVAHSEDIFKAFIQAFMWIIIDLSYLIYKALEVLVDLFIEGVKLIFQTLFKLLLPEPVERLPFIRNLLGLNTIQTESVRQTEMDMTIRRSFAIFNESVGKLSKSADRLDKAANTLYEGGVTLKDISENMKQAAEEEKMAYREGVLIFRKALF